MGRVPHSVPAARFHRQRSEHDRSQRILLSTVPVQGSKSSSHGSGIDRARPVPPPFSIGGPFEAAGIILRCRRSSALSGLRPSAQKVALLRKNAKAKGSAFAQSRKSEEEEKRRMPFGKRGPAHSGAMSAVCVRHRGRYRYRNRGFYRNRSVSASRPLAPRPRARAPGFLVDRGDVNRNVCVRIHVARGSQDVERRGVEPEQTPHYGSACRVTLTGGFIPGSRVTRVARARYPGRKNSMR